MLLPGSFTSSRTLLFHPSIFSPTEFSDVGFFCGNLLLSLCGQNEAISGIRGRYILH